MTTPDVASEYQKDESQTSKANDIADGSQVRLDMYSKVFQEELAQLQITPAAVGTPEAATRFLRGELDRWAPVVKAINLSSN